MFFFSKSDSLLGIDIGTSAIKAAQLKKDDQVFTLERYGKVAVVYPAAGPGKWDPVEQTAEALVALYEKSGFTTKRVIVSLPSNVAFVSVLDFPPMSEKEMERSVEYQAKKYIPWPLTDVSVGWQIIEDSLPSKPPATEAKKIKVLLTAVPKTVVHNYSTVISRAGLDMVALEIESLSLIRALLPAGAPGGILIVDIGAKITSLNVVHGRSLWASRHLPIGGDSITESIAQSLGVSFERAEELKRNSAVDTPGRQTLAAIGQEIKQLVRITESQGKAISKIILTGGGSLLPGIAQALSALPVPIVPGDPLQRLHSPASVQTHLRPLLPQFSVALGLAMRVVETA